MSTKSTKSSNTPSFAEVLRERFGELFIQNLPLAELVRAQVGGVAEYVVWAKKVEDLAEAGKLAHQHRIPVRVIAGGTAILPSSVGFAGLVIINQTSQIYFTHGSSLVLVESGVSNAALLASAAPKGLGGIEFLAAVPGSIGGAVITNAGFGDQAIASYVKDVTLLVADNNSANIVTVPARELGYGIHTSLLLKTTETPIVLSVRLQMTSLYQDEIMRRIRQYQKRSQLLNKREGALGGFLNPFFESETSLHREVRRIHVPNITFDPDSGVAWGRIGKARSEDYRTLINSLKALGAKYGITLEDRVTYLGYWPDEGDKIDD
jgi:UDP-N-acetylmuramate dehydrogenase